MDFFSSNKVLGVKYILLAGSKNLKSDFELKTQLAMELGKLIAREDGWVLINGGALNDNQSENPEAIDYFGAYGAYMESTRLNANPKEKILTILPKNQSQHSFHKLGTVEQVNKNNTALRRFEMVARADAIITIEGGEGIENILELGLSLNKIVLPIAITGGQSRMIFEEYEQDILKKFHINTNSKEYPLFSQQILDVEKSALDYINILKKALLPECFIIMPYNKGLDFVYTDCIEKVVEDSGFKPVKANEIPSTGTISNDIFHSISAAKYVIADITPINFQNNANVYYELGLAHGLKKETIIINQVDDKGKFLIEPPIDINNRRIYPYHPERLDELYEQIYKVLGI